MQPESRTAFLDDYRAIADAIRIESDSRYRIGDMERDLDRIRIASAPDAAAPSPTLRMLLQNDIYGLLYKRADRFDDTGAFSGDKSEFLIALSHANCGTGTWEPGWRIVSSTATGDVRVVSGDRCDSVVFDAGIDDIELPPDVAAAEGVRCRMRIPKELRQLNAHYYMAFGDARLPDRRDAQDVLLRYYWHLSPRAAIAYMQGITTRLNRVGVPFRTKVLSDPAAYGAADAGVLYVENADRARVEPEVMSLHAALSALLSPSVPLFTRRIAPGLGCADDPGNGESYGVSRARLAAEGLVQAHARGRTGRRQRIDSIRAAFSAAGIDPDRPYLQPMGVPCA